MFDQQLRGQAFEELEDLLAKNNICIAVKEKLVKDSGVAEEIAYDNIVQKLLTKPRARGKFFCIVHFNYLRLFLVYFRSNTYRAKEEKRNYCQGKTIEFSIWGLLFLQLVTFKCSLIRMLNLLNAKHST